MGLIYCEALVDMLGGASYQDTAAQKLLPTLLLLYGKLGGVPGRDVPERGVGRLLHIGGSRVAEADDDKGYFATQRLRQNRQHRLVKVDPSVRSAGSPRMGQ